MSNSLSLSLIKQEEYAYLADLANTSYKNYKEDEDTYQEYEEEVFNYLSEYEEEDIYPVIESLDFDDNYEEYCGKFIKFLATQAHRHFISVSEDSSVIQKNKSVFVHEVGHAIVGFHCGLTTATITAPIFEEESGYCKFDDEEIEALPHKEVAYTAISGAVWGNLYLGIEQDYEEFYNFFVNDNGCSGDSELLKKSHEYLIEEGYTGSISDLVKESYDFSKKLFNKYGVNFLEELFSKVNHVRTQYSITLSSKDIK